jgi:MoxR-like ATPase
LTSLTGIDFKKSTQEIQLIIENISKVIIGKPKSVELGVVGLLSGGHVLIEDVPGVGKTILARSIAITTGCDFSRIQFTPDLLPTDVSGVSIYNQQKGNFEFKEGPIISQIVLADEINRATPKTQSAMLEAMEEGQVTVEGVTRSLPTPFMVMATQNPIEYEGTFPLPEAQLDRFLIKISIGYPDSSQEIEIMNSQSTKHPIDELQPVSSPEKASQLQSITKEIYVHDLVKEYIVSIVEETRKHSGLSLGASPRGSLSLYRAAQALSLIRGRTYITPDDVQELALSVLGHRIILSASARMSGQTPESIVNSILESKTVPGSKTSGWFSSRG